MRNGKLNFPESLCERYRPRRIDDFIGLTKPKRILEAFAKKPFGTSWFFLGPSGVGKTTLAQALAKAINAEVHEIPSRACDLDKISSVTRMCHNAAFNFTTGKAHAFHLVIVNEADGMTIAAQNWLLSKLDSSDPPPRTVWIFTANTRAGLEDRFMSRCNLVEFTNESLEGELAGLLRVVYRKEGGKHPLDFEAIAKAAQYNVRDSLNKLQMELLIGTDRDGLPSEDMKIIPAHDHNCKKCFKNWKHPDLTCELPFRGVCESCGGPTSVGSLRALKAHETMRKKAIAEHEASKRKRKGKNVA